MPEPTLHAGPVDLDALDAFLLSDRAPDESMGLSDLDGFLAGIVVGPELVTPSEWLPVVWGGAEPAFESVEEARSILGTIMGRHDEIIRLLDAAPDDFDPVFWEGPDGTSYPPARTLWAAGRSRVRWFERRLPDHSSLAPCSRRPGRCASARSAGAAARPPGPR